MQQHIKDMIIASTIELIRMRPVDAAGVARAMSRTRDWLEDGGLPTRTYQTPRGDVLEARAGAVDAPHKVLWVAHLDVTGADDRQFDPYVDGHRLFGRGAYDMLLAGMCMRAALPFVSGRNDVQVRLVFVGDEESEPTPRHSIADYVEQTADDPARFAVIGEPTDLQVAWACTGLVRARFGFHGIAGHSSRAQTLTNPLRVEQMLAGRIDRLSFTRLTTREYPGGPIVEPTVRSGGRSDAETSIPAEASCTYTIRPLPGQRIDVVCEELRKLVRRLNDDVIERERILGIARKEGQPPITMELTAPIPSAQASLADPYLRALAAAVRSQHRPNDEYRVQQGASDLGFLAPIAGVEYGLRGRNLHGDDEWADLDSVEPYVDALVRHLDRIPVAVARATDTALLS